jgi:uncharacterized protein (DUF1015 family)
MVEIAGLRALRYVPDLVGALHSVVAPPYDIIGAPELRRLWSKSPYNVVRLILPAGDLPPERRADGYARAAERLTAWKQAGALQPEDAPAIYLYEQRFRLPDGVERTRRGFFALARLTEWGEGIYRHELTLPGPVSDRIHLLESCQANLSSIFGLYSDPQREIMAALAEAVGEHPPAGELRDDHGVWHGLWPVQDAAVLARVRDLMRTRSIVVADGHHRYTAALTYRNRMHARSIEMASGHDRDVAHPEAPEPAPWDYVLFYLVALEDPGLVILPTHQALHSLAGVDTARLDGDLGAGMARRALPSLEVLQAALADSALAGDAALGVVLAGPRYYLLQDSRPSDPAAPEDALDVAVLRRRVVEPLLARAGATQDLEGHLRYTHDALEAAAWVAEGHVQVAFVVRPTPLEQVRTVALAHRVMPQKSTYFYPKVLSGLVLYDHSI